jgi:3D (Asp-Asp-Asp) domain-containing protein
VDRARSRDSGHLQAPARRVEADPNGGATSQSAAGGRGAVMLAAAPHDARRVGQARGSVRQSFNVSAYCAGKCCCGPKARGVTASGKPVSANDGAFAAADRAVPFNTQISIPGYNGGKPVPVLDRGGAIRGNRLDVFFLSHRTALNWGRKTLTCEVTGDQQ